MKLAFDDLQKTIELHRQFLSGKAGGQRANLKDADLEFLLPSCSAARV
ncbi:MAG: hypothetical protein HPY59_08810 [Anaerolineae bacterium]|nr:hypothetical protein [Anaerolineae bacterium]